VLWCLAYGLKVFDVSDATNPVQVASCDWSGGSDIHVVGSYAYEGRKIKLCCKSCRKDFDKDSKQYMAKLKQVAAKAPAAESHAHHKQEGHQH